MSRYTKYQIPNTKNIEGVTSLATMLILGAVVVQIGLVGFILSYYLTSANAGVKFSAYAYSGAEGGIEEGIMRIIRDDYINAATFSVDGAGSTVVDVTICKGGTPATAMCKIDVWDLDPDLVQIVVASGSFNKQSLLVAIVDVDSMTHLVKVISIKQQELTTSNS